MGFNSAFKGLILSKF